MSWTRASLRDLLFTELRRWHPRSHYELGFHPDILVWQTLIVSVGKLGEPTAG